VLQLFPPYKNLVLRFRRNLSLELSNGKGNVSILYYNEDYKNNKKEVYTITSIATRKVTTIEELET
jgi:hypothetical protein